MKTYMTKILILRLDANSLSINVNFEKFAILLPCTRESWWSRAII